MFLQVRGAFFSNLMTILMDFIQDKGIYLGREKCSVVHNPKTDMVHLKVDPKKGDDRNLETDAFLGGCKMVVFPDLLMMRVTSSQRSLDLRCPK